jgi:crossover junction endodeoxyribonuclease RuvC
MTIAQKNIAKIALGLDPGTRRTGFCVLEVCATHRQGLKILDWGVWNFSATLSLGERLENLFEQSSILIQKWNPQVVGIEKAVVFKNIPSSLTLSEARGVLRLAVYSSLADATKRLVELSPTLVKKSNTGKGGASKDDIKRSLGFRWGLNFASEEYKNFSADAFDALAIATSAVLVHNRSNGLKTRSTLFPSRRRKKRLDFEPPEL